MTGRQLVFWVYGTKAVAGLALLACVILVHYHKIG